MSEGIIVNRHGEEWYRTPGALDAALHVIAVSGSNAAKRVLKYHLPNGVTVDAWGLSREEAWLAIIAAACETTGESSVIVEVH